jgi:hypothetical protein
MRTLKEPVIFLIEGTSFEVDVARQQLRQTNDVNNVISFTRDMQDNGTYYELQYELDRHCVQGQESDQSRIRTIRIPQMTELDPEGMAAAYGKPLTAILGKCDYDVIVNAELVDRRHLGLLPVIGIGEQTYIVDLRLKELRHLTDPHRSISLTHLDLSAEGDQYLFFYDLGKHAQIELDPKLTEFPEQVVLVKIPNEVGLDPVATAAAYGIDERQLLRRFPLSAKLEAQLVPLAETNVPAMISRNREALRAEHQQIMAQHKPRKGQRL